ncbi:MAG: hypothetical protein OXH00_13645 [Candidatus Poribacteria bacterium]|nr:hypothetical protein [Candidatus Poribacteria bacterium]
MKIQLTAKLKYVCLGLFLGFAIFFVGSLSRDIGAQDVPKELDTLTVKRLRVLEVIHVGDDPLNPTIAIDVRKINGVNNGDIAIDNGASTISIGTREDGAAVAIKSPRAMLKVENERGASAAVSAFNTHNSFINVNHDRGDSVILGGPEPVVLRMYSSGDVQQVLWDEIIEAQ